MGSGLTSGEAKMTTISIYETEGACSVTAETGQCVECGAVTDHRPLGDYVCRPCLATDDGAPAPWCWQCGCDYGDSSDDGVTQCCGVEPGAGAPRRAEDEARRERSEAERRRLARRTSAVYRDWERTARYATDAEREDLAHAHEDLLSREHS